MVDALERGEGRFAGVAMIDESFRDSDIAELHDAGVRGALQLRRPSRWRPSSTSSGDSSIAVQPWGWHIVLHFDAKDIPDYTSLLDEMPCPYVIDHMGRVPVTAGVDQEPFQRLLS